MESGSPALQANSLPTELSGKRLGLMQPTIMSLHWSLILETVFLKELFTRSALLILILVLNSFFQMSILFPLSIPLHSYLLHSPALHPGDTGHSPDARMSSSFSRDYPQGNSVGWGHPAPYCCLQSMRCPRSLGGHWEDREGSSETMSLFPSPILPTPT